LIFAAWIASISMYCFSYFNRSERLSYKQFNSLIIFFITSIFESKG
jgi:hypothetical protein